MSLEIRHNKIIKQLLEMGKMTLEEGAEVIRQSELQKEKVPTYLLNHTSIDNLVLAQIFSSQLGIPLIDLDTVDVGRLPQNVISEKTITKYQVLPLQRRDKTLVVAICDPVNTQAIDDVKFQTNMGVEIILAEKNSLEKLVEKYISTGDIPLPKMAGEDGEAGADLEIMSDDDEAANLDDASAKEEALKENSPVIKFVNTIIMDGIRKGASDLHFEPYEDELRIRFRIDGMLKTMARVPAKAQARISTRLKVMAQLDVAEHRLPQDGRMKIQISRNRQIDFRVSSCPTMFGEKLVLRILDNSMAKVGIDNLGYDEQQRAMFQHALNQPYGMTLITGPTGSGKTVSLYTGLNILNDDTRNISTVEDPVEIRIKGINQVQVNPKKGLTFPLALKSFLRQDPDVIMIGEIRDLETGEIAIKAAQTGHAVLSTIHTNDAPQALTRLANMGIAPYNLISSINLIIAQRLVRKLHSCKKPIVLSKETLLKAGFHPDELDDLHLFQAVGCSECNDGYKGRTGIFQVMPMSEEIKVATLQGKSAIELEKICQTMGIKDLRQSGLDKVRQGITSLDEVDRATLGN